MPLYPGGEIIQNHPTMWWGQAATYLPAARPAQRLRRRHYAPSPVAHRSATLLGVQERPAALQTLDHCAATRRHGADAESDRQRPSQRRHERSPLVREEALRNPVAVVANPLRQQGA
jgi:hypothetical protein